jgi:hypothetical protein
MSTSPIALKQLSARQRLAGMIGGYYLTQAIHVAAKLGIADRLRAGPRDAGQLARGTGTNARALHRMLRTLASFGLFAADDTGRYRLTELSELLRSDVPGSLRVAALNAGEIHYAAFGELLYSVRTGKPGFEKAHGLPLFDYFAVNREAGQIFNAALAELRSNAAAALLDVYDFSGVRQLVDVGGGDGSLLAAVLGRYPKIKGILFDLPHVVEKATAHFHTAAVRERSTLIGGDFFASAPDGGDVYLLRHVIHDWDDDKAVRILKNCRRAMGEIGRISNLSHSRLLLVESVIQEDNQPSLGKFLDLVMLAMTGGRERTEPEYRALLEASGFRLDRVLPTAVGIHVIEAAPGGRITNPSHRRRRRIDHEHTQPQSAAAAAD